MEDQITTLPPGLRFDPTDEELILHFLCRKINNLPCNPNIIPDLHMYASDPWDLNGKAYESEKEWYFFTQLKQQRSTRQGFWKEIGTNVPIHTNDGEEIGFKKYFLYCGDDNKDDRVGLGSVVPMNCWILEEYHVLKQTTQMQGGIDEWVLCRVRGEENIVDHGERDCYHATCSDDDGIGVELSYVDETFFAMDQGGEEEEEEITSSCH